MGQKNKTNIEILSHVPILINMDTKISKLNQNIRDILGKEGLAGYEVNENPENRTAEVRCSGTMVLIRGRDPISVREKKLKEFASPILEEQRHRLLKETMNLSYGSSINLIKSDSTSINLINLDPFHVVMYFSFTGIQPMQYTLTRTSAFRYIGFGKSTSFCMHLLFTS